MFFNSRSYATHRAANERELYIFPFLPSSHPLRRCLRKNQLYPAISIGLHAKMSTLYCHRYIIRADIGISHFPGAMVARSGADRGRGADQTTNPRICSCDIERACTCRVEPRDSHKNQQVIMRGELASQTRYFSIVRYISSLREIRYIFQSSYFAR